MSLIRIILGLIVLAAIGTGGLYIAEQRGLVASGTFDSLKTQALAVKPQELTAKLPQLNQVLSSKTSPTTEKSSVLGASVDVETREPPLSQKAFEYARYNYCKTAVEDYESRFPENK